MQNTIEIFDSTLRDGAQGEGISFSVQDKLNIVRILDDLGITFIEAGNPASNPKDMEFFEQAARMELHHAKITAFGSTRRKNTTCAEDQNIQDLLAAGTEWVTVFGKTWDFQVAEILRATEAENVAMIRDTILYLTQHDRKVIFDAEHFFDGYDANPGYALATLIAAAESGASRIVLCDTNGGTMPQKLAKITAAVCADTVGFPVQIGIHTHNDTGTAVATSVMAVEAGATHIQGTLTGFGERTGNANLATIIANLELKMHRNCLPAGHLKKLTAAARQIAEIANTTMLSNTPYVGQNAFAHKAGMHADAVIKNPSSYEHVNPDSVGNERVFLMSDSAGRALIIEKMRMFDPSLTKDSPAAVDIAARIKELEQEGYQFEGADGSFELLVRKTLGKYRPFFKLHYYKTMGERPVANENLDSFAQLKIEVDGQIEITAGEGNGPVHALDSALRKALERFYPSVSSIRLTDYKVRVLDSNRGTASKVRVLIDSSDGISQWTTVGVSPNLIAASWGALVDSFEYKLIKELEQKFRLYV